jgi:hypothetical protein
MSAFLIVAVFRNADGTLAAPAIWHGDVGDSPSAVYDRWLENLDNFQIGHEPIPSHMLEVDANGLTKTLPWRRVQETMRLTNRVIV